MRFLKSGFTLAELLLCIAIIGVVSALGMTATKQSAEKAYRGYYYTGFINLYNAMADFENENWFSDAAPDNNTPSTINNPATFAAALRTFFNLPAANGTVVTAKNGIVFDVCEGSEALDYYILTMRVPQLKSRQHQTGTDTVALAYKRDDNGNHVLLPIQPALVNQINSLNNKGVGQTNLLLRRDIFPVYVDDGRVGRSVYNPLNGTFRRTEKQYRTYNEAYCRINGSSLQLSQGGVTLIDCTGINNTEPDGVLKFDKPSRIK